MNRTSAAEIARRRLMRVTLERGLTRLAGRTVTIRAIDREFHMRSTSFHTEHLRVQCDDGRRLAVFFKDLNPGNLLSDARRIRARAWSPSRLEWRMYRDVLSPERFGTPRLYASRWQPGRGRCWLFLEDIGGRELRFDGRFAVWRAAARWAARLHAATGAWPGSELPFIPRLGRAHYGACAEAVVRRLPVLDRGDRPLARRALEAYAAVVPRLEAMPQSVIHGQFFGRNVMLRHAAAARRVTVVDWESAALGPSYTDIASLSSGRWTAKQKRSLRRAYFLAYRAASGRRLDWDAFCRDLKDLELHQALLYVGLTLRTRTIPLQLAKRRFWLGELRRALS